MPSASREEVQELDAKLKDWVILANKATPKNGWVKSIRNALGLTTRLLAKRMGVNQSRVVHIEKNEVDGNLTIDTLKAAASSMNCKFVYAIVPEISLEYLLKKQLSETAKRKVQEKIEKMDEVVIVSKEELSKMILEEAQNIYMQGQKKIWE